MGRPKGSKNAKPEAEPTPAAVAESAVSKAEAVRQALSAGMDAPGDIADFAKSNFGLDIPKPQASAYKAQIKAKGQKTNSETPKRGRKPKAAVEAHVAPAKIEAKGDGDLLDALKSLKGLVSMHGADKVKSMVDLLS
jgi:hypothetical protein